MYSTFINSLQYGRRQNMSQLAYVLWIIPTSNAEQYIDIYEFQYPY